jgi:hypothetical protein
MGLPRFFGRKKSESPKVGKSERLVFYSSQLIVFGFRTFGLFRLPDSYLTLVQYSSTRIPVGSVPFSVSVSRFIVYK